jgi:hypothetical protein
MAAAKKTMTGTKLRTTIKLFAPRGSVVFEGELAAVWLLIRSMLHFERKYLISHGQ